MASDAVRPEPLGATPSTLLRRPGLALGAALVGLASLLVPWSLTGSVRRSGFELAHAAERAGLVPGAAGRLLLIAVFGLPALVSLALGATILSRSGAARLLAGVSGAVVALAGAVVLDELPSSPEPGPILGTVSGVAACALALFERDRRRTRPTGAKR